MYSLRPMMAKYVIFSSKKSENVLFGGKIIFWQKQTYFASHIQFSHLFVYNYTEPKNYIIGHKTNKNSNRGVKIEYVMLNMFVFYRKIICPQ